MRARQPLATSSQAHPARRREQGMILLLVLFFILLLTASITSFLRRATMDAAIVRNRDRAASAIALARGGVRIGQSLIDAQQAGTSESSTSNTSFGATWQSTQAFTVFDDGDQKLNLRIEDASARLNINALLDQERKASSESHDFLEKVLTKVTEEMPGRPEDKLYDPAELAWNLLDYIDADSIRERWDGGEENEFYAAQIPPEHAANRPLLSLDELRKVEGFDPALVEGLRPYLTVLPYTGGGGINPNTAAPYVLSLLYHWPSGEASPAELASEKQLRDIVDYREQGGGFCSSPEEECPTVESFLETQKIFPPPSYISDTFRIIAEAQVSDIQRRIEVLVTRNQPGDPQTLLFWRED